MASDFRRTPPETDEEWAEWWEAHHQAKRMWIAGGRIMVAVVENWMAVAVISAVVTIIYNRGELAALLAVAKELGGG